VLHLFKSAKQIEISMKLRQKTPNPHQNANQSITSSTLAFLKAGETLAKITEIGIGHPESPMFLIITEMMTEK